MAKAGWYFNIGRKEFFCETERQYKTKEFLKEILRFLKLPVTDGNIKWLYPNLLKANLEIKWCPDVPDSNIKGHYYYNIFGDNFGGYGSSDINDGNTIVFQIN